MGLHTGRFRRLTVTMKLFPAIVTLHLLGGTGLLALLAIPASGLSQQQAGRSPALIARRLRIVLWLCLALLIVQVSLGGWVSTNYAVLACTTFPGCQGAGGQP
jgi:cytochrome c oxidase assembly protein subunit 15